MIVERYDVFIEEEEPGWGKENVIIATVLSYLLNSVETLPRYFCGKQCN